VRVQGEVIILSNVMLIEGRRREPSERKRNESETSSCACIV